MTPSFPSQPVMEFTEGLVVPNLIVFSLSDKERKKKMDLEKQKKEKKRKRKQ
jgi:hypothetical protein